MTQVGKLAIPYCVRLRHAGRLAIYMSMSKNACTPSNPECIHFQPYTANRESMSSKLEGRRRQRGRWLGLEAALTNRIARFNTTQTPQGGTWVLVLTLLGIMSRMSTVGIVSRFAVSAPSGTPLLAMPILLQISHGLFVVLSGWLNKGIVPRVKRRLRWRPMSRTDKALTALLRLTSALEHPI